MSFLKCKLKKMFFEDSLGIIVRSRFKESSDNEKLSLFHLNREVKRGKKTSLSKLSKIEKNERVVVEDKTEINRMAVNFFSSLF